MTSKRTITKNFLSLLSSQIIGSIISFIIAILIARYLGAEDFGKYAFAFAFANIAIIFTDYGINTYVIREIARSKEKTRKIFGNCLILKIIFSLLTLFVSVIIIYLMDLSIEMKFIVLIATLAMVIYYFGGFYRTLLMAYEIMEYEAIIAIIEKIVLFCAISMIILKNLYLMHLTFVFLLVYIFAFLMRFFIVSLKIGLISFSFDFSFIKTILRTSLPFWMGGIFIMLFFRIDSIMLKIFQNYTAVGLYNAASKLTEGLSFLPIVMIMTVFPAMSKFHLTNKIHLNMLYKKSVKYLFIIILPISIGTTILASRIISFIYKSEFLGSTIVLQILIWAEMIIFINYMMGYLLNSIDMQKFFTISGASCAFVNIILNLILIPVLSYIGAAISTVISQVINFILLYYFSSRKGYSLNFFSLVKKPFLAAIIMSIIIYFVLELHIFIIIPCAAAAYFLSLFLMKEIGSEEINLVKSLFSKE